MAMEEASSHGDGDDDENGRSTLPHFVLCYPLPPLGILATVVTDSVATAAAAATDR